MSEKELENVSTTENKINKEAENSQSGRFVKARDKYKDMKSSALCLFIISIAGFTVTILDCLDMFPIKINANDSWIFYFAMFSMYTIFIVIGICTVKSAKKIKSVISDEESQTDTIITWALDNLTADIIDKKCSEIRESLIEAENKMFEEMSLEDEEKAEKLKETFERTEVFDELPEELKCFDRENVISHEIKKQFKLDDNAYISSIIDEIYPEIFE